MFSEQDKLRLPYIKSIVQSCPHIQELEIIGHDNDSTFLTVEDLSSIAQLKNLKRLTLANFNVKDGLFLEHILMSCTQLESLRLKMIGPPGKFPCVYESHLMVALPFAKKLRTFW